MYPVPLAINVPVSEEVADNVHKVLLRNIDAVKEVRF